MNHQNSGQEKAFDYSKLSKEDAVKHLTRFIANIWQIHPFGDALVPQGTNVNNFHSCKRRGAAYGNTRTTAVFTIKYLNSLGFDVNNEPFEKNSWYFRNALVRAYYTNMNKGIYMNTEYLEKFFRNLLLGEKIELKNRYCHICYTEQELIGSEKTSEKILLLLKENPKFSAKKLSELLGISSRAVEKQIASLETTVLLEQKRLWLLCLMSQRKLPVHEKQAKQSSLPATLIRAIILKLRKERIFRFFTVLKVVTAGRFRINWK